VNALFYVKLYNHSVNQFERLLATTPDGPHDRWSTLQDEVLKQYTPMWKIVSSQFICLTPETVWRDYL
jgi:hypothetical protein